MTVNVTFFYFIDLLCHIFPLYHFKVLLPFFPFLVSFSVGHGEGKFCIGEILGIENLPFSCLVTFHLDLHFIENC